MIFEFSWLHCNEWKVKWFDKYNWYVFETVVGFLFRLIGYDLHIYSRYFECEQTADLDPFLKVPTFFDELQT